MRRKLRRIVGMAMVCYFCSPGIAGQTAGEWDRVGMALGKAGSVQPGDVYFWANDEGIKLARGLRAALDKTDSAE